TGFCCIAVGCGTYRHADLPAVLCGRLWTFFSTRERAPEARSVVWSIFDTCSDTDCVRSRVSKHAHMVDWRDDSLFCHTGIGLRLMGLCRRTCFDEEKGRIELDSSPHRSDHATFRRIGSAPGCRVIMRARSGLGPPAWRAVLELLVSQPSEKIPGSAADI